MISEGSNINPELTLNLCSIYDRKLKHDKIPQNAGDGK